jgi:hypothetical protein
MDKPNIKVVYIYDSSTQEIFFEYYNLNYISEKDKHKKNVENLVEKLSYIVSLSPSFRHTENLKNENILLTVGSSSRWYYITIVDKSFSEREGFEMLNNIVTMFEKKVSTKILELENESNQKKLKSEIHSFVFEQVKACNSNDNTIIKKINNDIQDLNTIMRGNIRNVIQSSSEAENLNAQSMQIKDSAEAFKKDTKEMRKITYWQNKKLTLIGGTLTAGALIYMILRFIK